MSKIPFIESYLKKYDSDDNIKQMIKNNSIQKNYTGYNI
jgi:hypothetical protein